MGIQNTKQVINLIFSRRIMLASSINIKNIFLPALVVVLVGLAIGLILGFAAQKLEVIKDEREEKVLNLLPGINCGACGQVSCEALSKLIIKGEAKGTDCPVADYEAHKAIGQVMKSEVQRREKMVAYVRCAGTTEKTKDKYDYLGARDCDKAILVPGKSHKFCEYGCLGYGNCVLVCAFDALHIVDGLALVDEKKCTGCKLCIEACPKDLITMVPIKAQTHVECFSSDKGRDVRKACTIGCIACGLCVKACEYDAIHVENNLASIDYEKCVNCGACAEVCPVKVIKIQGQV